MTTLSGIVAVLRQARKQQGITLEDIGELFGVTAGSVSHWELGRRRPDLDILEQWAGRLGFELQTKLVDVGVVITKQTNQQP